MLHVTQRALDELIEALDEWCPEPAPDPAFGLGFRIVVRGEPLPDCDSGDPPPTDAALVLALDEPGNDDEVICWEDRPILILARPIAAFLDGLVVDVVETPEGLHQLAIELPRLA